MPDLYASHSSSLSMTPSSGAESLQPGTSSLNLLRPSASPDESTPSSSSSDTRSSILQDSAKNVHRFGGPGARKDPPDQEPVATPEASENERVEGVVKTRCCCLRRNVLVKLVLLLLVTGAIVTAFPVLKVYKRFPDLLEWIEDNKVSGFFAFVGVYAIATVLFIPGAILALGGGFVFGLPLGTLAVWLGGTIGQTLAFLLGRFVLRDCIAAKARRFKIWRAIEHVANHQGWKIVALLRLAPVIPYDALNYAFGLTAVRFWQYFLASTIAIVPGSLLFVYFGSLVDCIDEIRQGDPDIDQRALIISASVSGVAITVVVALCTYYAKKALKKMIDEDPPSDIESNSEDGGENSGDTTISVDVTDSTRTSLSFTRKLDGFETDIESGRVVVHPIPAGSFMNEGTFIRQGTANLDDQEQ